MGVDRAELERLLGSCQNALERLVHYRVRNRADAQDLVQEVLLSAYLHLDQLREEQKFRAWVFACARNRITDYYRRQARREAVAPEALYRQMYAAGRNGAHGLVHDTLAQLSAADRALLTQFYLQEYTGRELARQLGVPEGTVKSRLNGARARFRRLYPAANEARGAIWMQASIFPQRRPDILLERSDEPPFEVVCEQDVGWFIRPRLGERAHYATYDYDASGLRMIKTGETRVRVLRLAEIHGLPCVEIEELERNDGESCAIHLFERIEGGRLQTLAAATLAQDTCRLTTFLDEAFLENWGFGVDNCGEETLRRPSGRIIEEGGRLIRRERAQRTSDVVGRYRLVLDGAVHDVVRLLWHDERGMLIESYIDRAGRMLLFRRYNREDWQKDEGRPLWSQALPNSPQLTLDGQRYVHWYDCLPDYAMAQ